MQRTREISQLKDAGAGCVNGNRLWSGDGERIFFGCRREVLAVRAPAVRQRIWQGDDVDVDETGPRDIIASRDVAVRLDDDCVTLFNTESPVNWLAGSDALGVVAAVDESCTVTTSSLSTSSQAVLRPSSPRESTPSSLCLLPAHNSLATTALFPRIVECFDLAAARSSAVVRTEKRPAAVAASSASPLLVVAEGGDVAVYDWRAPRQAARLSGSAQQLGDLLAVCADPTVDWGWAAAGTGRTVAYVDARKWRVTASWPNVTKFEIASLHMTQRPAACFLAAGVDAQLVAVSTKAVAGPRSFDPARGFLADSRWIGISLLNSDEQPDAMVGYTQSGSMYFAADVAALLTSKSGKSARQESVTASSSKRQRSE